MAAAFGLIAFVGLLFLLVKSLAVSVSVEQTPGGGVFSGGRVAPEGALVVYGGVGGFIEVVGESHYQPALKRAYGQSVRVDGYPKFWAFLEAEDENPHDANAVKVKFNDETIGYLTKGDAKMFRNSHAEAISRNLPIACRACLTGGTKGKPTIGVMLDFRLETQKIYKKKNVPL
jgi:hypothetical protein